VSGGHREPDGTASMVSWGSGRNSCASMASVKSTSLCIPEGKNFESEEEPGRFARCCAACGAVRRKAVPHCRALNKNKFFQGLMFAMLLCALFLPDLWVLADRPSNSDLDVLLTGVLLLFLGELGAQSLGLPSYPGSFFFWMDLLGAASLLMDLSYLPLFSAAAGASQSVLLTARLAKLGARACRLGRLGKLMRFLPGLGASNGQPGMANAISMKLNKMLSLRICCVIILMVITMPLFGMWSFPAEDWSIQSWMIILETTGLRSPEQLAEQLAEFERFYADLPYFPFRLEHSFNGSAGTVWEPRGRGGRAPRRRWNAQRIERPKLKCDFNFSTPNRWAAAANLMQTFLIMILMVVFSYFLSNSVSRIVLKPLKGLLDRVVGASKQIFASVARMADTVQSATEEEETVSRAGSSASWRPRTARSACSDEAEAEAEAEILLLEEVLEKLAVVASYVMKRKDSEEDSKENEEIMAGFRSGHHSSPKVMTRMKSMALEVQMSMLQNVGLSLDLVNSWHLNPLELDKVRCHAACTFFLGSHSHGAELDPARLGAFITALEAGYQNTPYHSWFHAVDVTHGVYRLLRLLGCEAYLGSLERWALLVAASGHDLGHPGLKNQFLVDTGHELALLYNDRSPLENMHCTRLFEVLAVPRQDVLADLTRPQWQEVRQVCVEAILNTDNSLHFRLTQELQVFYEMNSEVLGDMREFYAVDPADFPSKESLEVYRSPEARQHFWKLLLHVSDLSNPTKPFRISRIWANRCIDEFLAQGDRERAAGLPVHALHDREKVDRVYSQLGFIEFLVAPLALVVVKLLPPYTPCVEQMLENLRRWQEEWFQAAPRSAEERRALDERAQRLERRFVEGT